MFFDLDAPIKVTGFGRINQSQGFWHDDWITHHYTLIYLLDGDLELKAGDTIYAMESGDTVILPPKIHYRPLHSNGCVYYHFYFHAVSCDEFESSFSICASHCHSLPNFSYGFEFSDRTVIEVQNHTRHTEASRLNKIFNHCAELDLWKDSDKKMLLDNYLREILIQLSLMRATKDDVESSFVRMTTFINSKYNRDISLFDVAESAHLSPSYAAKIFKKNAGLRCCDYINNVRLTVACGFLVNTSMRIGEIAERVGYKSQYYFARQFKKVYGMTAMEYRKNKSAQTLERG